MKQKQNVLISEEFKTLAENSPDIIDRFDRNFRHLYDNPAGLRTLGLSAEQVIGKTIRETGVSDPYCSRWEDRIKKVFTSAQPLDVEDYFPGPTGVRYFESRCVPEFDSKGLVHSVLVISRDITERKRVEEDLRQREADLAESQRVAKIGSWTFDFHTNHVRWSKELFRIFDIDEKNNGSPYSFFLNCVHPDDRTHVLEANAKARTSGQPFNLEYRITTSAGEVKTIREIGYARKDEAGMVVSLFGTAQDITEQKKLADAFLRESEEKYKLIAETSIDGIVQLNVNGIFTYVSPSVKEISGYEPKELIGTHFTKYVPESSLPSALEMYNRVVSGKRIQFFEMALIKKDGNLSDNEINAAPIMIGGKIIGIQGIIRDVSKRVKAQKALKESEEKYRLHFSQVNDVIYSIDNEFRILDISPSVEKSLGYKPDHLIGRPFQELNILSPEYFDQAFSDLMKVFSGEHISSSTYEFIAKDGTKKFGEVSGAPLIKDNKVIAVVSVARDISERVKAQAALNESEKNLESIFDAITESVFLVDTNHTILKLNNMAAKRLGSTVDQMCGKGAYDLLPEDLAKSRKSKLDEVFRAGIATQFEDVWAKRHMRHTVYPVFGENGKVTRVVAFSQDIHDAKMAEKEVIKFKTISDQANYGALIYDRNGNIEYINRAFARLHGFDPDELTGKDISIFHTVDQMVHVRQLRKMMLKDGGFSGEEVWHKRKDGSIFPMLMNAFSVKDKNGDPLFMFATAIDIMERIKDRDELKASHEQLKQLNNYLHSVREQERIKIGHELHDELGQVLTAINLEVSAISNNLPQSLQHLKSRAEAISELAIGAIQSVKRIISELRPTLLDDLGLAEAIRWQTREYQSRMAIRFDVIIDPEDFALDDDLSITVFRIFQESMTNAIRHSHATRISVRLRQTDAGIELKVKDNGIGITEDKINRDGSFGIKGIQKRAEAFNGTIDISGVPGKGTTLVAKFPV